MSEQPEALRLAEWAEWFCKNVNDPKDFRWVHMAKAAAELRRLHEVNQELLEALELLASYTESCEGLLNASPAGQVLKARAAIAKGEQA